MDPLVSIPILCHDYGRFLAEAIESALAQSYARVEVVVWDDGSTDDTREVAGRYPEVELVSHENVGLVRTCNRAVTAARGEWFCFLSADDRFAPTLRRGAARVGARVRGRVVRVLRRLALRRAVGRPALARLRSGHPRARELRQRLRAHPPRRLHRDRRLRPGARDGRVRGLGLLAADGRQRPPRRIPPEAAPALAPARVREPEPDHRPRGRPRGRDRAEAERERGRAAVVGARASAWHGDSPCTRGS